MSIHDFVQQETEPALGVATPLAQFRRRYEQVAGRVNRSIFLNGLGAAGCRLVVTGPSIVYVIDRCLRPTAEATKGTAA
jgi:hypothetical protein